MKTGSLKVHLGVRGPFSQVSVPACGAWSRQLTDESVSVTCADCKATLDYAMAGGNRDD